MKELGITKGTYWMGKNAGVVVTDSNSNSGKDTPDSVNYYGGYLIAESMTAADAELLIDAGNTAQKCGLLPSELLRQRDELKEELAEQKRLYFKLFEEEISCMYCEAKIRRGSAITLCKECAENTEV